MMNLRRLLNKRSARKGLPLSVLGLLIPLFANIDPAQAACIDPPRPGSEWLRCNFSRQPFISVNLSDAKIFGSIFNRADLTGSVLAGVDGRRTKFVSATLPGVIFTGAVLSESDFTKADLSGANFKDSDLRKARFFRANLRGADFTGAQLRDADLLFADLSGARWTDGETICAEGSISQCR